MTTKVTVLYTPPADAEAFEQHYARTHRGLVAQMPGLERAEYARVVATADGSPLPYHRIVDLYFQNVAAVTEAFASPAGRATTSDTAQLTASTGSSTTIVITEID